MSNHAPRSGIVSIILYGSHAKLSNAHKLVSGNKQPEYYVRADTTPYAFDEALNHAKPLPGETVLNTVPVNPLTPNPY